MRLCVSPVRQSHIVNGYTGEFHPARQRAARVRLGPGMGAGHPGPECDSRMGKAHEPPPRRESPATFSFMGGCSGPGRYAMSPCATSAPAMNRWSSPPPGRLPTGRHIGIVLANCADQGESPRVELVGAGNQVHHAEYRWPGEPAHCRTPHRPRYRHAAAFFQPDRGEVTLEAQVTEVCFELRGIKGDLKVQFYNPQGT